MNVSLNSLPFLAAANLQPFLKLTMFFNPFFKRNLIPPKSKLSNLCMNVTALKILPFLAGCKYTCLFSSDNLFMKVFWIIFNLNLRTLFFNNLEVKLPFEANVLFLLFLIYCR